MAFVNGKSFADEPAGPLDADEIMIDYLMDLCESVYYKMSELGIGKKELAKRMGKKPSQVTRILSGEANVTLRTVAELDSALGLGISLKSPCDEMETVETAEDDSINYVSASDNCVDGTSSTGSSVAVTDEGATEHYPHLSLFNGGLAA